jgi:LysM repeat protein
VVIALDHDQQAGIDREDGVAGARRGGLPVIGRAAAGRIAAPASAGAPGASASHSAVEGNTHTVARGETLTSIAKMYKVTVDDLQKANHIEDGRKLQAGQTITIPTESPAASSSPSP